MARNFLRLNKKKLLKEKKEKIPDEMKENFLLLNEEND